MARILFVSLILFGTTLVLSAQNPTADEALAKAEKHYKADELMQAEPLFRAALVSTKSEIRRQAYDRLLAVYLRLGRPDRSLNLISQYSAWLKEIGDRAGLDDLQFLAGDCYLTLGHYADANRNLLAFLKSEPPPVRRMQGLYALGSVAAAQGDKDRAADYWKQVCTLAKTQQEAARFKKDSIGLVAINRLMVDAFIQLKDYSSTMEPLKEILSNYETLEDNQGRRDTLTQLATTSIALRKYEEAKAYFQKTLEVHEQHFAKDRLTVADLLTEQAGMLRTQKREAQKADDADKAAAFEKEAVELEQKAAKEYLTVLSDPSRGIPEVAGRLAAFWKLQNLYRRDRQFQQALRLISGNARDFGWDQDELLRPRINSQSGGLELLLGRYRIARDLLKEAVVRMENQRPLNLTELPRVLSNLSIVELGTGHAEEAAQYVERIIELYRDNQLPIDPILAEAYDIQGNIYAQRGSYAKAIQSFRTGLTVCEKAGPLADVIRCDIHINMTLIFKEQGDIDAAIGQCNKANEVFTRIAAPDDIGFAVLDAVRADLLITQNRIAEAALLPPRILKLCQKYQIQSGFLVITALHVQALEQLQKQQYDKADSIWAEVEAMQRKDGQIILLPRTLNYRGLVRERKENDPNRGLAAALPIYQEALKIHQANPKTSPVTRFITLYRLAEAADTQRDRINAWKYINEALEGIDQARLQTFGDAQQRATFFGQFAPAFEKVVDWCVRDGALEPAFSLIARVRSRTLLDQMLTAGVDPLATLEGPDAVKLRKQEAELKTLITQLRSKAQTTGLEEGNSETVKKIVAELDKAQDDYALVWREILNANPLYRALALNGLNRGQLQEIRKQLGETTGLLAYFLGRNHCYAFYLPPNSTKLEVFPLKVSQEIASKIGDPRSVSSEVVAMSNNRAPALRGAKVVPAKRTEVSLPAPVQENLQYLTSAVAERLVNHGLDLFSDQRFSISRGVKVVPRKKEETIAPQRPDLFGAIFLPEELRKRIQATAPEMLVIVPDGALHRIPLEALPLASGDKPVYAMDVLPPIVYAPSTTLFSVMTERAKQPLPGKASLLTVGDPAYPEYVSDQNTEAETKKLEDVKGFYGFLGQLTRLPASRIETQNVRKHFRGQDIVSLEGETATEANFRTGLVGKRFIHVAAHGFADERFGNLFAALALAPPSIDQMTPENDGLITLRELHDLKLQDCDCAVLSACVTNVGPQRPQEAGVTLANAFLNAGARRVIATMWVVDDDATAELMDQFFTKVGAQVRKGDLITYAKSMREARMHIRSQPKWSTPFYWAPFVLIGPPQ